VDEDVGLLFGSLTGCVRETDKTFAASHYNETPGSVRSNISESQAVLTARFPRVVEVLDEPATPGLNLIYRVAGSIGKLAVSLQHFRLWTFYLDQRPRETSRVHLRQEEVGDVLGSQFRSAHYKISVVSAEYRSEESRVSLQARLERSFVLRSLERLLEQTYLGGIGPTVDTPGLQLGCIRDGGRLVE